MDHGMVFRTHRSILGRTPWKLGGPGRRQGHSQDSHQKNRENAEEKIGAGEGNRTLVFVGTGQIIENRSKNARLYRPLGTEV